MGHGYERAIKVPFSLLESLSKGRFYNFDLNITVNLKGGFRSFENTGCPGKKEKIKTCL